jgi:menaquinone-dependent protoporphyrinogen oxidase
MRSFTRREFLWAGSVLTGLAASCCVPGSRGLLSAGKAHAAGVDFAESSCKGSDKAGKKILVAYASRSGSTGGVAEAIGRAFCEAGFDADVRLVKHAGDVSPYSGVVLGSAVNRASWLSEAIDFAEKHREALSKVPVAYFLTCVTLYYNTEEARKTARSYMEPVLKAVPEVRPVDCGYFGGVLDYSKMNMVVRMVMKSKMKEKGIPEGDFRKWDAIQAWAKGVAVHFGKAKTVSVRG